MHNEQNTYCDLVSDVNVATAMRAIVVKGHHLDCTGLVGACGQNVPHLVALGLGYVIDPVQSEIDVPVRVYSPDGALAPYLIVRSLEKMCLPKPPAWGHVSCKVYVWGIGWTVGDDRTLNDAFFWSETETGWPSLYYKDDGYHFGDILTWTKLTQLSRNWSIGQLMIYHAVVLGVLAIPLLFILVSMSKLICSVLGTKKAAKAEGQTEEAQ
ncbi:hypothetical protein FGIG_02173 [Fasciola gigantica]|uniref:Uncharacterized protein n=1 Tax=Fasciola gigantica TaxID=46835 RepID=A0A504YS44_FASGI|nr:hypothetical protein FGIG_02173 [Fasciola gigantica]